MQLKGVIEQIRQLIEQSGPLTARQIETHPEVVKACRSSKTKARRHIERLVNLGKVALVQKQPPTYCALR